MLIRVVCVALLIFLIGEVSSYGQNYYEKLEGCWKLKSDHDSGAEEYFCFGKDSTLQHFVYIYRDHEWSYWHQGRIKIKNSLQNVPYRMVFFRFDSTNRDSIELEMAQRYYGFERDKSKKKYRIRDLTSDRLELKLRASWFQFSGYHYFYRIRQRISGKVNLIREFYRDTTVHPFSDSTIAAIDQFEIDDHKRRFPDTICKFPNFEDTYELRSNLNENPIDKESGVRFEYVMEEDTVVHNRRWTSYYPRAIVTGFVGDKKVLEYKQQDDGIHFFNNGSIQFYDTTYFDQYFCKSIKSLTQVDTNRFISGYQYEKERDLIYTVKVDLEKKASIEMYFSRKSKLDSMDFEPRKVSVQLSKPMLIGSWIDKHMIPGWRVKYPRRFTFDSSGTYHIIRPQNDSTLEEQGKWDFSTSFVRLYDRKLIDSLGNVRTDSVAPDLKLEWKLWKYNWIWECQGPNDIQDLEFFMELIEIQESQESSSRKRKKKNKPRLTRKFFGELRKE